MKMRPYQDAAITGAFEAWKEATSALIVLPTGLGKTTFVYDVLLKDAKEKRKNVLILSMFHRDGHRFNRVDNIRDVRPLPFLFGVRFVSDFDSFDNFFV